MTTIEFLSYLRSLDVRLWVDGGRLRYSAPKGAVTPALRAELVERKAEILAFLGKAHLATHSTLPPLLPISRDKDLPLSFAQQRLWFLDHLEPDSPLYNIGTAVRLTGPLDVMALKASLNEIVRRHEVLRTVFLTVDGKPAQLIRPELTLPLPVVDLRGRPAAEREAEALLRATEDVRHGFDLSRGPLIRASLLRLDEEEHIALLTMHHIVSDGWSAGVLIREVAALYDAFSKGRPSPLPELPIQYVDYAHWQRQWLRGEVLESQLAYWKQQLKGPPPRLELPADRPRPAVQTSRGALQWFELPWDLFEKLLALSQQENGTLFMTLLAAFQALLYRYTEQEDISIGTPIAGRNRPEIEGLIGFFVNTLVLRTDLTGSPSFRELLRRVREVAEGAYACQDLPFEMLVDELQPEREMSHTPLFQAMFVLQNAPMKVLELPGLIVSPLEVDSGTAKFDLTLSMAEIEGKLKGSLEYNTDLFDAITIKRMPGHFLTLLESIVADPDQRIADLPLLTPAEQRQLLVEWNDTAIGYPADQCVHHLVQAQAERVPDAIAAIFENEHLTYGELNRRANQLAHHLQKLGVGPETLVALLLERSLAMLIGVLGVLKAGGAYVPMDPAYPQERLAFMLDDAQALVLLAHEHLLGGFPTEGIEVVCLDVDWADIALERDDNPVSGARPDNLAYVIYTSGSSGRPKGVMIRHRSVLHLATALHHIIYNFQADTQLRVSLNAPLPFDASVQQLVMLLYGHTLYIIPQAIRQDGESLLAYLKGSQLDVLDCVPSQLKLLLAAGLLDESGRAPGVVLPGGEAIDESTWQLLAEAPATEFYNMYGPTECSVDSTIGRVKMTPGRPTIGRPVTNAQLYVLDRLLHPVPVGVPGELHIGGVGVARGYLKRSELTAERFIPDPFSNRPGARLYKTGDLARYRPDGTLEFLGRMDHQVKVRGFRIELGEIEAVLEGHPAVRRVVALAREDTPGAKRLVAYVVPEREEVPSVGEMRGFLKEKLPEYMVPSAFVMLETLPMTPNGKIDRRALPAPDQSRPDLEAVYVAPRTHPEELLADIWAEVLGVEQVGVYDHFFELGGDSILAIQVIARANQAGLQLIPRQLFLRPTVAGLVAVAGSGPAIHAEQGIVEGPVPLTPIQCWFFGQDFAEPQHWNQSVLLEVRQRLEPALLEEAVQNLLAHHDALRLRFRRDKSGWEQVNTGVAGEIPFFGVDLSDLPEAEQGPAVETKAAEFQAGLDLAVGPLLRVAYFDLGPGRSDRLLLVVHHLAIDGVSWRILLEDLHMAYLQLSHAQPMQLPSKTTSFKHWAQRLREYSQTETAREELPYWLALAQKEMAPLPVDYPGGLNVEASAHSIRTSLTSEETQALLQEVPAAYGTEINDALLTALAQAMTRWTGSRRLLLDLEGHGREDILDDVDLSRTVGWFTTLYPVALDLEKTGEPGEVLKAIKEQLRRVPQRGIGYSLLRYGCQDEQVARQMQALPCPEVSFNYLGQFDQAFSGSSLFRLAAESSGPERSLKGRRSHVLMISGAIVEGQLRLEWSYSQNLHRRATIEALAEDLMEALRAIIAHCQLSEAVGYTPSDFPDVELSQDDIGALMAEIGEAT